MTSYVYRGGLEVADVLAGFVENQLLPGLPITPDQFWSGYAALLAKLMPVNRQLLATREELQAKIDSWLEARRGEVWDAGAYREFLREIGYLLPDPAPFQIGTENVDAEIAELAGPQLVVPVSNARFALNAANARWGSLYDALYGTDVLGPVPATFDPTRRDAVMVEGAKILDRIIPLAGASHADVDAYHHECARFIAAVGGREVALEDPSAFVAHGASGQERSYLFRHHGLHLRLLLDPSHPVGAVSPSGLRDIVLESALTAIQDAEDSVAAVDAEDKVGVYANWLGLMKGDLSETFEKGGKQVSRHLNADLALTAPDGSPFSLPGRALLLVRNVGHLMTTDAVRHQGEETPEGMLDAFVTVACALHDLRKAEGPRNSRTGSIYVVKPKMHGPEEVAFADTLYAEVEDILGLDRNTVKLGVMDEERRTSVNLSACIHAVKDRIAFINTGFLDRTGDEIHTSMRAGPFVDRSELRHADWLGAYEDGNVDRALAAGFRGRAQIGKGMWAKPDAMAEMLETKVAHPLAGASTAWVPSPTAATLHALHYHQVDVAARQAEIAKRAPFDLGKLLTIAVMKGRNRSEEEVAREVDNNCQGILGYVVRWVDQGIGCSKVPDIHDVAMMEDRATCRISAQYLANWLLHGVVSADQVEESLRRMAAKVDAQNAGDPGYIQMAPPFADPAFLAARELVFEGQTQPSGYTEPVLHRYRARAKQRNTTA